MSSLVQRGWSINAFIYDLTESGLSDAIDSYILGVLAGEKVLENPNFRAVDYGSGTGKLSLKLARALQNSGNRSGRVFSVENNPWMIKRQRKKIDGLEGRLGDQNHARLIAPIERDLYSGIGSAIAAEGKVDLAVFKRCLYAQRQKVEAVLRETYEGLKQGGSMFIVHPETDFWKYCDNGKGGFAPLHAVRWGWAELGKLLGEVEYKRRSSAELRNICEAACPNAQIRQHFPQKPAYNVLQVSKEK